ncbi:MAG TPA: hypothetical protein VFP84_32180 [Kofleriaceae bacterium]|nr:hypothetical protein [Kofleriaceae bacterium]
MRSEWITTALMMVGLAVLCCIGFILTAGCTANVCSRGSDCATGLVCSVDGACVAPPIDAAAAGDGTLAASDAATTSDASAADAAPKDASP